MRIADVCKYTANRTETMDVSVRKELGDLVESMTHSGLPSLDETQLKRLKKLCRTSDANVRAVHELVMTDLAKKHAEVRLSAFHIAAELFPRSHLFRRLITADFQRLAELVTGTDPQHPLPPPKPAATHLKETSLLAIRHWNDKFGDGYPKLKLGFNHLKHNKKVDFERLVAQTEVVRRRNVARDARREAIAQQRLGQVHIEIADQKYDIENCLKEMESCFDILIPRFFPEEAAASTLALPMDLPPSEKMETTKEKRVEFRDRNLSSNGSFVSLEDDEDESEEEEKEEEGEKEPEGEGEGGGEVVVAKERSDDKEDEEEICADEEEEEEEEEEEGDDDGSGCSSEESDIEWEEVDPLPDPLPGPSSLKDNGYLDTGTNISIQIPTKILVEETEDNTSVLTVLTETHHLLKDSYLPRVNRWLEWLTKAGDEQDLKDIIDLKSSIMDVLEKHKKINVAMTPSAGHPAEPTPPTSSIPPSPPLIPSSSSSGSLPTSSISTTDNHPPSTAALSPANRPRESLHSRQRELEQDPTTIQAQLGVMHRKRSDTTVEEEVAGSSKSPLTEDQKSNSDIPTLPFDMDLYHWDNPEGKPPPVRKVCMSSIHQYWGSDREIELSEDQKALLRCRSIRYTGKFEPVKWSCRAPLPSGKLCPRRDRFKCPFHGVIIARDEQGHPAKTTNDSSTSGCEPGTTSGEVSSGSSTNTMTSLPPSSSISDSDFREIEAAVFASQGLDLPAGGKGKNGKRGRKKKYPGLTDLKAQTDTPRSRLEKRIFNKRAMKKVAGVMDALNTRRHHDKFGDTFNYALKD